MSGTLQLWLRRTVGIAVLTATVSIWGCADKSPPLYATLTFKADGSHFSGTVVRREPNSITILGTSGDTHTYLYTELSDIQYGAPETPGSASTVASNASAPSPSGASETSSAPAVAPIPKGSSIEFPEGTVFPVRNNGFLDTCCVPLGAFAVGTTDSDVKLGGKVAIPAGSNVSFELIENTKTDGRLSMTFELGTVDFGNRHYIFEPAKPGPEHAIVVTFQGAKEGTPEAKDHGLNAHLENNSLMEFKAATAVNMKPSE